MEQHDHRASGLAHDFVDQLKRVLRAFPESHERDVGPLADSFQAHVRHLDLTCDHLVAECDRVGARARARAASLSPRALRRELAKRTYLSERIGPEGLDLEALAPSGREWLAQLGRRSRVQPLRRCYWNPFRLTEGETGA